MKVRLYLKRKNKDKDSISIGWGPFLSQKMKGMTTVFDKKRGE